MKFTADLGFEFLIAHVQDAVILEEDFYETFEQIMEGIASGKLNKNDYEIQLNVIWEGVFQPSSIADEFSRYFYNSPKLSLLQVLATYARK